MALAVVLLTGAGLLIRSFAHIVNVDPGFRAANVLTAIVNLPASRYPDPAKQASFFEEALRRIEAVPGIDAAAASNSMPLNGINDQGGLSLKAVRSPGRARTVRRPTGSAYQWAISRPWAFRSSAEGSSIGTIAPIRDSGCRERFGCPHLLAERRSHRQARVPRLGKRAPRMARNSRHRWKHATFRT